MMKKLLLILFGCAMVTATSSAQVTYATVNPAAETVLPKSNSNYVTMTFVFTFSEAITATSPAGITFKGEDGTEFVPDDAWYINASNGGKTQNVWGADYDGFTCSYAVTDQVYNLNIPAGAFKNAAGAANEAFTVKYYGMQVATGLNDINTPGKSVVARYNLNGQRVNTGHSGVQVVTFSDGSSMKVYVK